VLVADSLIFFYLSFFLYFINEPCNDTEGNGLGEGDRIQMEVKKLVERRKLRDYVILLDCSKVR